ncbi:MAG: MotA/TolQ/ExbB proton channel family protein [Bacteroidia bacterium]|nr:MotA/TolQ/ExbB proton channel family protein [Bacteroidia bacterium]
MSKKGQNVQGHSLKDSLQSIFALTTIVLAVIISFLLFKYWMGSPANFQGGNPEGNPLPGSTLAIVYKGGYIVPFLMSLLIILITFSIERMITLSKARGKRAISNFVLDVQTKLHNNQIDEVVELCAKQKGSLANVVQAGMMRYHELQEDKTLEKDQKVLAMQKELEEATALELPMLSKNLVILSTIASISVLTGLLGTVLGMIRAFKALAQAGAPDALALATGISEALINTAFGITGSLLAIILYNYFSNKIDGFTYKIDEANFSIVQTFASQTK